MKQEYVVGFAFTKNPNLVVMVHKNRPTKGFVNVMNGVGGAVEPGEPYYEAMIREFQEETGVRHLNWQRFGWVDGSAHSVHAYVAMDNKFHEVKTTTDEVIELVNPLEIFAGVRKVTDLVPAFLGGALSALGNKDFFMTIRA